MTVKLLQHSDIDVLDTAVGKCWGTGCRDNEGDRDKRLDRVINKNQHGSIAEHYSMSWDIDALPRFVLQELVRHRMGSYSVRSSRFTLQELKKEPMFTGKNYSKAKKYIHMTGSTPVDMRSIAALRDLQEVVKDGISNDITKACMPESYLTSLVCTMNLRGFKNFYHLRVSKSALKEIRELAEAMYEVIPDEVKFLIKDK